MPSKFTPGYVYFVQCSVTRLIKVGYSASYPDGRLTDLQVGSPTILQRFGYIVAGRELEADLHERFAEFRDHGEWFRPGPGLMNFIVRRAMAWDRRRPSEGEPETHLPKWASEFYRIKRQRLMDRLAKARLRWIDASAALDAAPSHKARKDAELVLMEARLALNEAERRIERLDRGYAANPASVMPNG